MCALLPSRNGMKGTYLDVSWVKGGPEEAFLIASPTSISRLHSTDLKLCSHSPFAPWFPLVSDRLIPFACGIGKGMRCNYDQGNIKGNLLDGFRKKILLLVKKKKDSWGKRNLFFHLTLLCVHTLSGTVPTLCDDEGSCTEAKSTEAKQSQRWKEPQL